MYGKPVSLTFQGNDKFRTTFGATVTVIVSIFLISFGLFTFLNILRGEVETNHQIMLHANNLEEMDTNLSSTGYDPLTVFAFGFGKTLVN